MIDPATFLAFSAFENKGVYCLLLGSGLSRAAQIPTGWEITLDLIKRRAALEEVGEQADWAAWYRETTGKEPNYSDVLDALSSFPDERRSILHSYIEPTAEDISDGKKVPTPAHHAIAWLVREGFIRVILTTNFDRLMENALREAGVEPTVIRSDDDLRGAVPLIHSRCFIVKLHGDYLDTRIKNTDEELGTYSPVIDNLLDRVFDDHGLIVCGWSGEWDHALRNAIKRTPNRRFPTFWAARGITPALVQDLIDQRRAQVIRISDADGFFTSLQQKIATQVEMRRPNPRSVDLIVATVKRQVGRSEFRIQLNDLLAHESRILAEKLNAPAFATQGGTASVPEFRSRVARYEAAAQPLARIFGILGRWGTEAEFSFASEILGDFAHTKIESGLNWWIDLKLYPAVLLLYAYGLGVLKAGNYGLLYRWLTQNIRREERKTVPVVTQIGRWWSDTHDRWKSLEGLDRHKTPLSDHLHQLTGPWTADYALRDRNHTLNFETFEVLLALAYLSLDATKENFKQAHADTSHSFVWSPVSRASWDNATSAVIFPRFDDPETRDALLKAGFGAKDDEFLTLALTSIRRLMCRVASFG